MLVDAPRDRRQPLGAVAGPVALPARKEFLGTEYSRMSRVLPPMTDTVDPERFRRVLSVIHDQLGKTPKLSPLK